MIEPTPPRTPPRTSSGKLSRAKARNLDLSGEIQLYDLAAWARLAHPGYKASTL